MIHDTLHAVKECNGSPKSGSGFISRETLQNVEENHAVRLADYMGQSIRLYDAELEAFR